MPLVKNSRRSTEPKVLKPHKAQAYVADPRWRLNPLIRQIPCTKHDPSWWDSDNRNSLAAIKLCAVKCPLRRDCYGEGVSLGDIGVIRGGYKLTNNSAKLSICQGCGTHSVRVSKTKTQTHCTVCLNTRRCKGCGIRFYAEARGSKPLSEYCTKSCKVDTVVKRLKAMRARKERAEREMLDRLGPLIARLKAQRPGA